MNILFILSFKNCNQIRSSFVCIRINCLCFAILLSAVLQRLTKQVSRECGSVIFRASLKAMIAKLFSSSFVISKVIIVFMVFVTYSDCYCELSRQLCNTSLELLANNVCWRQLGQCETAYASWPFYLLLLSRSCSFGIITNCSVVLFSFWTANWKL
jgi:hypothetical protein